jgi:tetratricopeptide (TPR) repeat protein
MNTLDLPIDFSQFEIVNAVQVPVMGDRQVRLRTLEEAIEDLMTARDSISEETAAREGIQGYFIQVKPKSAPKATTASPSPAAPAQNAATAPAQNRALSGDLKASMDGIYLPDGTLNLNQLFRSAELLFESGEYNLARKIYKAIMKTGERPCLATREMGRCFEAEGKLEEARALYEESIAYQPLAETFKLLAALLIQLKKDEESAETLDRALLLKDLSEENRFNFHQTAGNCWARLESFAEAERHFRRALDVRPDADVIRCSLGAIHLQRGHREDAERHFQEALNNNPKNHVALSGLGSCALVDGNKTAAHAYFARALKIEIMNPTAIFHLVKCAYEIKTYNIAAQILEHYIQVAPLNAHLLYSLAGLQYHLGRMNDATATCRKIVEVMPEHTGANELIGRIENLNGE